MKYFPVYKCNICDCLIRASEQSYEAEKEDLPAIISKIMGHQQFMSNPYLRSGLVPMQVIHNCKGGGAGVASFAGFMPEDIKEKSQ